MEDPGNIFTGMLVGSLFGAAVYGVCGYMIARWFGWL